MGRNGRDGMTRAAENTLLRVLRDWAARHPRPDEPILCVPSLGTFSANQIIEEVGRRTPAGRLFIKLLKEGCRAHTPEAVLRSFSSAALLEKATYL